MCRAVTIGLSLIVLVSCSAFGTSAHASETCHTPAPRTLIRWFNAAYPKNPLHYDPQNSAIYHPISTFRSEQPAIHWIGLAWLSPVWGALFAVNCNGVPLSAVSEGAVGKISPGPVLPTLGQTVMFEYVDHETANCVHDSIAITALTGDHIVLIWKHEYGQGLSVTGSGKFLKDFISKKYAVSFDSNGQTIHVAGKVLVYPYLKDRMQASAPSVTQILRPETYHWNAKALRFLPEKPYPQTIPCAVAG